METCVSLKQNTAFKKAYYKGRYKVSPSLVTYILKNDKKKIRFGITTSKKLGNAVTRNRARRIIKAAFFELLKEDEKNSLFYYDLVFVARDKIKDQKMQDVKRVMKKQINSLLIKR